MFVKLTDKTSLDDKHDPKILKIHIVSAGILVATSNPADDNVTANSTQTFYPWHRIEFIMGQRYKTDYEHELEQFKYLGGG